MKDFNKLGLDPESEDDVRKYLEKKYK
jgi:hypothetical protein